MYIFMGATESFLRYLPDFFLFQSRMDVITIWSDTTRETHKKLTRNARLIEKNDDLQIDRFLLKLKEDYQAGEVTAAEIKNI